MRLRGLLGCGELNLRAECPRPKLGFRGLGVWGFRGLGFRGSGV